MSMERHPARYVAVQGLPDGESPAARRSSASCTCSLVSVFILACSRCLQRADACPRIFFFVDGATRCASTHPRNSSPKVSREDRVTFSVAVMAASSRCASR